jgi:hypothetical protein
MKNLLSIALGLLAAGHLSPGLAAQDAPVASATSVSSGAAPVAVAQDGVPEPRTAMMGVALQPIPPMLAAHLPPEAQGGLVLSDVVRGGPAAKAGLRQYDVIASHDPEARLTYDGLRDKLEAAGPGKTLRVRYFRGGEAHTADVTLVPPKEIAWRQSGEVVPEGEFGVGPDGRVYVWPPEAWDPAEPSPSRRAEVMERLRSLQNLRERLPAPPADREPSGGGERLRELERRMERIEAMLERLLEER